MAYGSLVLHHDIFNGNARTIPRADFTILRRNARRGKCSYRFGRFYIGRDITACDANGCTIQTRAAILNAAIESRRMGLQRAAREILAMLR
jgi:hypothetical protein